MDRQQNGDPGGGGNTTAADDPVLAGMMEELGVGRMDQLPLEDRGPHVPVHAAQPAQNQARQPTGNLNPWLNVVFDDVDPSMKLLDNIAGGQLYRMRRDVFQPTRGGGRAGRDGRGDGKAGYTSCSSSGRGDYAAHSSSHSESHTPHRRGGHLGGRGSYQDSTPSEHYNDARHGGAPIRTNARHEVAVSRPRKSKPIDIGKAAARAGHDRHQTRASPAILGRGPTRPFPAYATGVGLASADDFMGRMTELSSSNATRIARLAQEKQARAKASTASAINPHSGPAQLVVPPLAQVASAAVDACPTPAPTSTNQITEDHMALRVVDQATMSPEVDASILGNLSTPTIASVDFSEVQAKEQSALKWNDNEDGKGKSPAAWKRPKSQEGEMHYANEKARITTWQRPEKPTVPDQTLASCPSGLSASRWAPPGFVLKASVTQDVVTAVNASAVNASAVSTHPHAAPALAAPIEIAVPQVSAMKPPPSVVTTTEDLPAVTNNAVNTIDEQNSQSAIINLAPQTQKLTTLRAANNIMAYKNGVLIENGNKATVQLLTDEDQLLPIIAIEVESIVKLHQVIAEGDIFKEEGAVLIFQPVAKGEDAPTWRLIFPLPYLPRTFIGEYYGLVSKRLLKSSQDTLTHVSAYEPLVPVASTPGSMNDTISSDITPSYSASHIPEDCVTQRDTVELNTSAAPTSEGLLIDFSDDGKPEDSSALQDLMPWEIREEDIAQIIKALDGVYGSLLSHVLEVSGASTAKSELFLKVMEGEMRNWFEGSEIFSMVPGHIQIEYVKESARLTLDMLLKLKLGAEEDSYTPTGFEDEFFDALKVIGANSSSPSELDSRVVDNIESADGPSRYRSYSIKELHYLRDPFSSSQEPFLNNPVLRPVVAKPTPRHILPGKHAYPVKSTTKYVVTSDEPTPATPPRHNENKKPTHWTMREANATIEKAESSALKGSSCSSRSHNISMAGSTPKCTPAKLQVSPTQLATQVPKIQPLHNALSTGAIHKQDDSDMRSMLANTIKPESSYKSSASDDSSETIKPAKLPQHRTGLSDELQALTISHANESRQASLANTATKIQQPLANKVDEILKSRPGLSASRWATDDFGASGTKATFRTKQFARSFLSPGAGLPSKQNLQENLPFPAVSQGPVTSARHSFLSHPDTFERNISDASSTSDYKPSPSGENAAQASSRAPLSPRRVQAAVQKRLNDSLSSRQNNLSSRYQ